MNKQEIEAYPISTLLKSILKGIRKLIPRNRITGVEGILTFPKFVDEVMTFSLGFPRQTGATQGIIDTVKSTDDFNHIILTHNEYDRFKKEFTPEPDNIVITRPMKESVSYPMAVRQLPNVLIWVDEANHIDFSCLDILVNLVGDNLVAVIKVN